MRHVLRCLTALALAPGIPVVSQAGFISTPIDVPGAGPSRAPWAPRLWPDRGRVRSGSDDVPRFSPEQRNAHDDRRPRRYHHPADINDAGQIGGAFADATGLLHGFVLSNRTFTTIDVPRATSTGVFGINDAGQIVGDFIEPGGSRETEMGRHPCASVFGLPVLSLAARAGYLRYSMRTLVFRTFCHLALLGGEPYMTRPLILLAAVASLFGTPLTGDAAPVYNFTTIDFSGGAFTSTWGINNAGQIVGYTGAELNERLSFVLSDGAFTTFAVPGRAGTGALAINSAGQIVGNTGTIPLDSGAPAPDFQSEGFLLSGGTFSLIDVSGAQFTQAIGINDAGEIVGNYRDAGGVGHGYVLSGGGFRPFDFPGAVETIANGINSAGQIVGNYATAADAAALTIHGFLLSEGRFTAFDPPGAQITLATGINSAGQIVGSFFTPPLGTSPGVGQCPFEALPGVPARPWRLHRDHLPRPFRHAGLQDQRRRADRGGLFRRRQCAARVPGDPGARAVRRPVARGGRARPLAREPRPPPAAPRASLRTWQGSRGRQRGQPRADGDRQ